jgi:hypothetical protein
VVIPGGTVFSLTAAYVHTRSLGRVCANVKGKTLGTLYKEEGIDLVEGNYKTHATDKQNTCKHQGERKQNQLKIEANQQGQT